MPTSRQMPTHHLHPDFNFLLISSLGDGCPKAAAALGLVEACCGGLGQQRAASGRARLQPLLSAFCFFPFLRCQTLLKPARGALLLLWVWSLAQESAEQVADGAKCEISKPQKKKYASTNKTESGKKLFSPPLLFFFWLFCVSGGLTQRALCPQLAALLGEAGLHHTMQPLLPGEQVGRKRGSTEPRRVRGRRAGRGGTPRAGPAPRQEEQPACLAAAPGSKASGSSG